MQTKIIGISIKGKGHTKSDSALIFIPTARKRLVNFSFHPFFFNILVKFYMYIVKKIKLLGVDQKCHFDTYHIIKCQF